MGEQLQMRIEYKQRSSYQEVNTMLERNLVDLAFICTGAYAEGYRGMDLLVAPTIKGHPYYHALVITHIASGINRFSDLEGRSFVYTDPLSNTGKLYAQRRILEMNRDTATFFSATTYSVGHDVSIQMVARNLVDGASVSSIIFQYLDATQPQMTRNIRVLEQSELYGAPPIVTSLLLEPERRAKILEFFTSLHLDAFGRRILTNLLVEQFVVVDDTLYDNVREMNEMVWQ